MELIVFSLLVAQLAKTIFNLNHKVVRNMTVFAIEHKLGQLRPGLFSLGRNELYDFLNEVGQTFHCNIHLTWRDYVCCTQNPEYTDDVAKLNLNEGETLKRGCGQFTKNIAFIRTTPEMPILTPEFETPTNGDVDNTGFPISSPSTPVTHAYPHFSPITPTHPPSFTEISKPTTPPTSPLAMDSTVPITPESFEDLDAMLTEWFNQVKGSQPKNIDHNAPFSNPEPPISPPHSLSPSFNCGGFEQLLNFPTEQPKSPTPTPRQGALTTPIIPLSPNLTPINTAPLVLPGPSKFPTLAQDSVIFRNTNPEHQNLEHQIPEHTTDNETNTPPPQWTIKPSTKTLLHKFNKKYGLRTKRHPRVKTIRPLRLARGERKLLIAELNERTDQALMNTRLELLQRNLELIGALEKALLRMQSFIAHPLQLFTEKL